MFGKKIRPIRVKLLTKYDLNPENREQVLTLLIKNINPSLANALRRTMIADIPTIAIGNIITDKGNKTVLHEELIAHRLGEIPLLSDPAKHFEIKRQCECEDLCARCCVRFYLDVEATRETGPVTVFAKHLIGNHPTVKPIQPNIEIMRLGVGDKLKLGKCYHSVQCDDKTPTGGSVQN